MDLEGLGGLVLSWEGKETGVEEYRRDFIPPLNCVPWCLDYTMGSHYGVMKAYSQGRS